MKEARIKIVRYALVAVGLAAFANVFFTDESGAAGIMITWACILLGTGLFLAVALPLINMAKNPSGAKYTLIGLAVITVIIAICWSLSSGAPVSDSSGGYFDDPFEVRLSETGIYAGCIALVAAIVLAVIGEIRNSIK